MLDLPASVKACLFDLDRVLTQAARLHAAAWKAMFDGYLRQRVARMTAPFLAFDPVADTTRTSMATRTRAACDEPQHDRIGVRDESRDRHCN